MSFVVYVITMEGEGELDVSVRTSGLWLSFYNLVCDGPADAARPHYVELMTALTLWLSSNRGSTKRPDILLTICAKAIGILLEKLSICLWMNEN